MGACFEVYKRMGGGFLESVYQECLAIEFGLKGIPFQSQPKQELILSRSKAKHLFRSRFYLLRADHRRNQGRLDNH